MGLANEVLEMCERLDNDDCSEQRQPIFSFSLFGEDISVWDTDKLGRESEARIRTPGSWLLVASVGFFNKGYNKIVKVLKSKGVDAFNSKIRGVEGVLVDKDDVKTADELKKLLGV